MFSALAEDEREIVLRQCFEPLLDLVDEGHKFAIQISGLSLEIVNKLDPDLISRLSSALLRDNFELVGNGYSQIIQPLAPGIINLKNQIIGKKLYKDILGQNPSLASVNEMAYTKTSSRSFLDAGYQSLLMEWNNSYKFNSHWNRDMRYFSQKVSFKKDTNLNLIWGDSIVFQKFQRYVHGEIDIDDYLDWIQETASHSDNNAFLCLYCSDAEVFDYRPKRYGTESLSVLNEWNRISSLFESLDARQMELVLPSQAIHHHNIHSHESIELQTAASPVIVKKQEKYNINRWAITGKNDFHLNSRCYKLLSKFDDNTSESDWKNLLFLWSSDLRTHIESQRWHKAQILLKDLETKHGISKPNKSLKFVVKNNSLNRKTLKNLQLAEYSNILDLNPRKGLTLDSWIQNGKKVMGTIPHGYYEDISFAADYYSCASIIEPVGERKIADLNEIKDFKHTKQSVEASFVSQGVKFYKKYQLKSKNSFEIHQRLRFPSRSKMKISQSIFTFLPDAWDQDSLFFSTCMGGDEEEIFYINEEFDHSENLNLNVGSKNGFFSTNGNLKIGDKFQAISFQFNLEEAALMPKIIFKKLDTSNYFLRLILFSQDTDETFQENQEPIEFYSKVLVSFHYS